MLLYLQIVVGARLARRDERGASAVEYGLMIAGVAGFLLVVLPLFGKTMELLFLGTCTQAQNGSGC